MDGSVFDSDEVDANPREDSEMRSKRTSKWTQKVSLTVLIFPTLFLNSRLLPGEEASLTTDVFRVADFSMELDSEWDSKSFKGNTHYERVWVGEEGWVLKAVAMDSASWLLRRVKIKPKEFPILRWSWRVEELPSRGNEAHPEGDDAAARILLIFKDGILPWKVKSICYLWANRLPKGASADNVFSPKVKMVAVRSGTAEIGIWKTEERDYVADYQRLFGKKPKKLIGIAIMTDTDNTGSRARAFYDFIELGGPVWKSL